MESIIASLTEAKIKLDALIKATEDREAQAAVRLAQVNRMDAQLKEKASALSVREDEVKRFGNVEIAAAELGKAKVELATEAKIVADAKAELQGKVEALDKKQAELNEIVRIYKINMDNCARERVALEDAKVSMKADILKQLGEGLK